MLFFKPRQKTDDLLPPPPPPMDFEEELTAELEPTDSKFTEKPNFFDEIAKPKKTEPILEEREILAYLRTRRRATLIIPNRRQTKPF